MSSEGYNILSIEETLAKTGEVVACTSGYSMSPMLRNRKDMVVIVPPKFPLKLHDVVLYRVAGGKLLLHRIIKIKNNEYVIRGDSRMNNEYGITDQKIIGVLKGFYRDGKYYDCENNKKYRFYIILNRASFPLRFIYIKLFGRITNKIKRTFFRKKSKGG